MVAVMIMVKTKTTIFQIPNPPSKIPMTGSKIPNACVHKCCYQDGCCDDSGQKKSTAPHRLLLSN